jgi:hypothetical protein
LGGSAQGPLLIVALKNGFGIAIPLLPSPLKLMPNLPESNQEQLSRWNHHIDEKIILFNLQIVVLVKLQLLEIPFTIHT